MSTLQRQDSGLCSDLMTRLSISGGDEQQQEVPFSQVDFLKIFLC